MTITSQAIGVFDSGIGGLTALVKLAELLPNENFIYLGDTARVPYGNRSPETICLYAQQCAEFLLGKSVKFILIACNSISAVALQTVEQMSPVPVMGVIKPTVLQALHCIKPQRLGIIGTRATIQSRSYELEIEKLQSSNVDIYTIPCPLFVPLVEEGWHCHPAVYSIAREYLTPLLQAEIETLILGCTHYPLLKTVIQDIMPQVCLIDSGEEAAKLAAQYIIKNSLQNQDPSNQSTIDCYLTDITDNGRRFVKQLLGLSENALHEVSVER